MEEELAMATVMNGVLVIYAITAAAVAGTASRLAWRNSDPRYAVFAAVVAAVAATGAILIAVTQPLSS